MSVCVCVLKTTLYLDMQITCGRVKKCVFSIEIQRNDWNHTSVFVFSFSSSSSPVKADTTKSKMPSSSKEK